MTRLFRRSAVSWLPLLFAASSAWSETPVVVPPAVVLPAGPEKKPTPAASEPAPATAPAGESAPHPADASPRPTEATPRSAATPALDCPPVVPAAAGAGLQPTTLETRSLKPPEAHGTGGLKQISLSQILTAATETRAAYVPSENERVVLLDMPSTREQGRMFGRIVIFVEKGGTPKTRVMTVPEVKKWLAQNKSSVDTLTVGNNLRAGELARFFNTARNQGEALTGDEKQLYDLVLQWRMLRENETGVAVVEPERILITIPQASSVNGCSSCSVTASQRETIMRHEMSHARFATDTVYQNYAIWFWSNTLSAGQRERFTRFLITRGYDPTNRELLANEAQAFLMHTPDPAMFPAAALSMTDAELNELRAAFTSGIAARPLAIADKTQWE